MRRHLLPLALLFLALGASPAWAVREWYDHYADAEKYMRAGRWADAQRELQRAVDLQPTPGEHRPYGMVFVHYFPYFRQGECYLHQGDFMSAVRLFNVELEYKQIQKQSRLHAALLKLKTDAESGERQRVVQKAREDANRLLKEATDLARAKKYQEALARLAEAEQAGTELDSQTQRRIVDLRDRVREEEKAAAEGSARSRRIEQALAEGRRLLQDGRDTEAVVRFDEVLSLDPRHATALEGKREAQDKILAQKTHESLRVNFEQGQALFKAGKYEEALPLLTSAAVDATNEEARSLLEKTQKIVEGLRRQREIHQRITELLADGDALLQGKKFPEAQVRFESVLALDSGNVRAAEKRALAERLTGEALFDRWMPPQPPVLTFFVPLPNETETRDATVWVGGIASDDRSIARIEFLVGGRLQAREVPLPHLENTEANRHHKFQRMVPLSPGTNDITVVAVDGQGMRREKTFQIVRHRRLYEEAWFVPAGFATSLGLVGLGFIVQRARQRRAVRRRFNPYIAGAPVLDDTMFFGRKKLLTRILNVLHHNSLMITGERRIGKTTLLYHLKKALEIDDGTEYRFFPVFIDLQGVPETAFFRHVMADVAEGLSLGTETTTNLRVRAAADDYDGRDFSHDLQRVIEELKRRTSKKVKLALLIDEVDVLNSFSERINQRLRSIFMKTFSEHLVAIMSGVGVKRTWNSEGSPWYNFFDEIEVTPLVREEAEALIRQPVQGVFRYDPQAVETILQASGGKPYLIQRLCIHAVNRMLEQGRTTMTADDVKAALEMDRSVSYDAADEAERQTASA